MNMDIEERIKTFEDSSSKLVDKKWYDEQNIVDAIKFGLHPFKAAIDLVYSRKQLFRALRRIPQENYNNDCLILLNVNVILNNFKEDENNHWVGLHIKKVNDQIENMYYFDPKGNSLSHNVLWTIYKATGTYPINKSLKLQFGSIIGKSEKALFHGNDYDCGVFISHILTMSVLGKLDNVKNISNDEESIAFGQALRKTNQSQFKSLKNAKC